MEGSSNEVAECPDCGNPMEVFDGARTEEYDGQSIDNDGEVWVEWKSDDSSVALFKVCTDCDLLTVSCESCGQDMQFLGHMGYGVDNNQYQRIAKSNKKVDLGANATPPKDLSRPRFDISDLSKMKFRMTDWKPSGPKGDMPHFWYCMRCEENHHFSSR